MSQMKVLLAATLVALAPTPTLAQAPATGGPDPGVTPNRLIDREEVRVSRVEIQPGSVRSVHAHDDVEYHLWIPLEGQLEITIGSASPRPASPGEAIFLERGTRHGFRNVGATTAAVLEVFIKQSVVGRSP